MKVSKSELEVDFIGGAGSLTKEEEKMISDFIKSKKQNSKKRSAQHRLAKSGRRLKQKSH